MQIKANDRVLFVGKTGSGKTYAAEQLARPIERLIVADPKGMLKGKWDTVDWDSSTTKLLNKGEPIRVRIPAPLDKDWEKYFQKVYEAGDCTLYIDEMYGVITNGNAGPYLTACYTRGRELGIGTWAATQRPRRIPIFARSEAEWIFCFRLKTDADRKVMAEEINAIPDVPAKDEHGFFMYYDRWNKPKYYQRLQVKKGNNGA